MSPVTSLCLALAGLCLLGLDLRIAPRWRALILGSLGSIIISISVVAVLGYAFGLPGAYGWGHLTRMAVHTAFGVGLLGAAFFMIAWHIESNPGERTPRWLPLPMAFGVFTGALVLYFALASKQDQEIMQTVKAGAESVKNQIGLRMDGRMRGLARMARRWEMAGSPGKAAWEADAADYVHDVPDAQSLEWIDTDHRIRWVVPLTGNETKLNLDLTQEARRKAAMERAERENQAVMTGIVTLFRGGLGFIIYVPIVVDGQPQGYLGAVLDSQICLDRYLPASVAAGEAIRIRDRSQTFFERDAGAPPGNQNWVVREKIELHGTAWDLEMWPAPALASRLDSPLPTVVLCAGALGSLLLAALCFYAQRASREAAETARANAALQAALDQVKTLEGLLPICSCCKRVRDDTGYWNQIDTYLHRHTRASLSHGYCPECAIKACEEFGIAIPAAVQAQFDEGKFE
jgi:sensor domain CHASE-containing protein